MTKTVLERISKHLDFDLTDELLESGSPDCWVWRGASSLKERTEVYRVRLINKTEKRNPVPLMRFNRKLINPPRILYQLATGTPLTRRQRLESACSDPLCINPAHRTN